MAPLHLRFVAAYQINIQIIQPIKPLIFNQYISLLSFHQLVSFYKL